MFGHRESVNRPAATTARLVCSSRPGTDTAAVTSKASPGRPCAIESCWLMSRQAEGANSLPENDVPSAAYFAAAIISSVVPTASMVAAPPSLHNATISS
jgi:hypothetical protein